MSAASTGRYLKGPSRPRVPGVVYALTVDTTAHTVGRTGAHSAHTFARAHITRSALSRGRWSAPEVYTADTPEDALSWMRERASAHRLNWVVAPVASDALTLLRWWGWAERQGVVWRQERITSPLGARAGAEGSAVSFSRLVVRGTPDIIRYHHEGRAWQWVSGRQYMPDGPGEMGAPDPHAGEMYRECGRRGPISPDWSGREAMAWSRAFRRMCLWWSEHARAPFGATVAQCAVSVLRSHCPPRTLSSHRNECAAELERAASFGGRASVWYVGAVGRGLTVAGRADDETGERCQWRERGPLTQVDVRSMYPSLLRDRAYPVKLHSVRDDVSAAEALDLSRDWGVIARVSILAREGEYPVRSGQRVYYPTGQLHTVLCGPELLRAAETGSVLAVHRLALYRLARPFSGACQSLLALREAAQREGSQAGGQWAKLLANSLGGKLAQRSGQWVRSPADDEPGRWGTGWRIHAQTGQKVRYRFIAGVCWRHTDDERAAGPYAAAFAYLTAYGREWMRSIRELCPPRSVVSQDTDGLWLLPDGMRALERERSIWGSGAGGLRVVCSVGDARFLGPRHYYAGGRWTLAGFAAPRIDAERMRVWDTARTSIWGGALDCAPCEIHESHRASALRADQPCGEVGTDGWLTPFRADRLPT